MNPRDEQLRRETEARLAELQAKIKEFKRRPGVRKPSRPWLIIPVLAAVISLRTWELYTRHNGGWPAVFNWHNWIGKLDWADIVFPGLILAIIIYGLIDSHLTTRRQLREFLAEADWNRQLDALVDIQDYPDREDLYICLDDADRPRLLAVLERQPKGSRSLRAAVQAVDPELIEDPKES